MEENHFSHPSENHGLNASSVSSSKGMLMAMDQPVSTSLSSLNHESSLEKTRRLLGLGIIQTDSLETSTPILCVMNDQFHLKNHTREKRLAGNDRLCNAGSENIGSDSLGIPPEGSYHERPDVFRRTPLEGLPMVSNSKRQRCSVSGKSEACGLLSLRSLQNLSAEQAQACPGHQVSSENFNASSESFRSTEMLQPRLQPNKSFDISGEQSDHCPMDKGSDNPSYNVKASSVGQACNEQNENSRTFPDNVQVEIDPLGIKLADTSKWTEQENNEDEVNKESEMADTGNSKCLLADCFSSHDMKNGDDSRKNESSHDFYSHKLEEKNTIPFGKTAPPVSEKIWVGSLLLNSSISVSTVAFFKSGEKLLDMNWPDFVEVKGKVRLDAFEKYIQDLPRSRSRGLMVVSLCWKEGSSAAGLKGMKEVSRGYRKGERVGFAQLSPGVDLYICPRSNTIITILAKHGFFKGMAAVEKNQDSLIGCLVWKKNRLSSSSSVGNTSEKPLGSTSVLPTQHVGEKNSSALPTPLVSASFPSSVGIQQTKFTESKHEGSDEVPGETHETIRGVNPLPSTSAPVTSSCFSLEQRKSTISGSPQHCSKGQMLEVETSCVSVTPTEKLLVSSEIPKAASFPVVVTKHRTPTDDDDLPEFDFGAACGITSKTSDMTVHDKRFLPGDIKIAAGPVLPSRPVPHTVPASFQRIDRFHLLRTPSVSSQELLPKINVDTCLKEKPGAMDKPHPAAVEAAMYSLPRSSFDERPKSRNLFDDDDDDMPEWCPTETQKPSWVDEVRMFANTSRMPNSHLQNRPSSLHSQRSPFPACTPPTPSFRPSHSSYCCPTSPMDLKAPETMPPKGFPRFFKLFSSDRDSRFRSGFLPDDRKC